jgi:hypothetical protein
LSLLAIASLFAQEPPTEKEARRGAADQSTATANDEQSAPSKEIPPVVPNSVAPVDKRVFGVLPNYRTAEGQLPFERITARQKFLIATKDSFDYPVLGTTGFFAGLSQLQGSNNEVYGQGMKGFAYRFGISYADQVIGNYFPEAIVPSIFHTDPRYFRKGEGSGTSRLWYAVSRIFVCKNDHGNWTFNVNEFVGNGLASMTVMSYHLHERTAGDAVYQWGSYVATDMAGQIMKEFWPDVKKKLMKKHTDSLTGTP